MTLEDEIADLTARIAACADRQSRGELIFRRGRLRWKLQDRAGAISDYAEASELAPDCGATQALAQSREIMSFYNKDLYNP